MKALLIYGSRYGNTQKIAEAISRGLRETGSAQCIAVDEAAPSSLAEADLIVVGGPTEAHNLTPAMKDFFAGPARSALKDKPAVAFDTRLDWPAWLSGSASVGIAKQLRRAGAALVAPVESFIVKGNPATLEPGEVSRAVAWGRDLARVMSGRLQTA